MDLSWLASAVVGGYVLLFVVALIVALAKARQRSTKVKATIAILAIFISPVAYIGWDHGSKRTVVSDRVTKADALFRERCKKAGITVLRKDTNVPGVLLMKIRPKNYDFSDQFALTDPYGRDSSEDGYIMSFLRGHLKPMPGTDMPQGFSYVEAVDGLGIRYRYSGSMELVQTMDVNAPSLQQQMERAPKFDPGIYEFRLQRVESQDDLPRYGVTYDDISTPEEREHWIAGSSLRVVDLRTNEVIAERIGYMMDRSQGHAMQPWIVAADNACPPFKGKPSFIGQVRQSTDFVQSVLTPSLGN